MRTNTKPKERNVNKPAYVAFLLAGIYFLIQRNLSEASTFWALALIFDPFDTKIPFKERPVYQQLWLYVHLSITLALIVLALFGK